MRMKENELAVVSEEGANQAYVWYEYERKE